MYRDCELSRSLRLSALVELCQAQGIRTRPRHRHRCLGARSRCHNLDLAPTFLQDRRNLAATPRLAHLFSSLASSSHFFSALTSSSCPAVGRSLLFLLRLHPHRSRRNLPPSSRRNPSPRSPLSLLLFRLNHLDLAPTSLQFRRYENQSFFFFGGSTTSISLQVRRNLAATSPPHFFFFGSTTSISPQFLMSTGRAVEPELEPTSCVGRIGLFQSTTTSYSTTTIGQRWSRPRVVGVSSSS